MYIRGAPLLILSLAAILAGHQTNGARILGLFAFPGPSHYFMTYTVMKELASRGHQVRIIIYLHTFCNYKNVLIIPK